MAKQPRNLAEVPMFEGDPNPQNRHYEKVCGAARMNLKDGTELIGYIAFQTDVELFYSEYSGFRKSRRVIQQADLHRRSLNQIKSYVPIRINPRDTVPDTSFPSRVCLSRFGRVL